MYSDATKGNKCMNREGQTHQVRNLLHRGMFIARSRKFMLMLIYVNLNKYEIIICIGSGDDGHEIRTIVYLEEKIKGDNYARKCWKH